MVKFILNNFTTEQKVEAMLANPIIEFIFMILFITFIVTIVIHCILFTKLRAVRNHMKATDQMDIEPLRSIKEQFKKQQNSEPVHVETFVQEKFSSWRLFNFPIVHLIRMIQSTISIFILIGVLGTFIGLTISLGSINSAGDQLVENVASVLSGIDVAFYTSIVGMGSSLLITVILKVFNTEYMLTDLMLMTESHLAEHEQHGMGRLINVSESINKSIDNLQVTHEKSLQGIINAFAGFKDYTEGLQRSAKDLSMFNEGLSDNLDDFQALFHEMKTVTSGFSEGTTQLNKNFSSLFSYFKKSEQRNQRTLQAFEQIQENIQEVSKAQNDTFTQFTDVTDDLKEFISSIMKDQSNIHNSLIKVTDKIEDLAGTIATHNDKFKQIFGGSLSTELSGIAVYLGELSKDFDKLGDSIVHLPEALELINQTQHKYRHLLSDRFEELKEFNQSFSEHLKNHVRESATFERQMNKVSTTFEQISKRNSQLIQDMNTTLSQIDRTFNQRENQLETNVRTLKDTLTNYVNNVEGTLSQKLDHVIRQIGSSMDQTSEGIMREFSEIRRLTEDIHINQARALQQLLQDVGREIQMLNHNVTSQQQRPVRIGWNQNDS